MFVDYSLYLITDRSYLKGRDLFKAVEEALKGGVTLVQLREKDISSLQFFNIALKMKELTTRYHVPLIINDRLDIALAVDAEGLHIGQSDLPITVTRKLLGTKKILGYSANSPEEAVYGEKCGADYLGVGPVYPTGSKSDAGDPIGVPRIKEIVEKVAIPVVGIGGIGIKNIKEVKTSGAKGVSLISAILGSVDIEGTSKSLLKLWRE
jgi:thiamine-phosphate pyrophosphorylase